MSVTCRVSMGRGAGRARGLTCMYTVMSPHTAAWSLCPMDDMLLLCRPPSTPEPFVRLARKSLSSNPGADPFPRPPTPTTQSRRRSLTPPTSPSRRLMPRQAPP
jgi:hypothetical protein